MPSPDNVIANVFVEPDVRRKRLNVSFDNPDGEEVTVSVADTAYSGTTTSGEIRIDFDEFESWSPDTPRLYTLLCEIPSRNESVQVSFGMRECTVKENHFTLNQRSLYLRGINLVATDLPEDDGAMMDGLVALRGDGFNFVRVEHGAWTESLLECADQAGLLVCLVVDSVGSDDEFVSTVRGYLNHASLAAWSLRGASLGECLRIRELDSSRLIFSERSESSGAEQAGFLLRPYRDDAESFDDLRLPLSAPLDRASELFLSNSGEPGTFSLVTELGTGSRSETADALSGAEDSAGLVNRVCESREQFVEQSTVIVSDTARRSIEAVRSNRKIAGYCLGAISFPREAISSTLRNVQSLVHPLIQMPRRNLVPREEADVSIRLANELRLEGRVDLSLQVIGPTEQVLWKKKRSAKIPRAGKELWAGDVAASGSTGLHKFAVRLMQGMERLAESSVSFNVFAPVEPWSGEIHLLDPHGDWGEYCLPWVTRNHIEAPIHIVPPLGNTIRAYPDNELAQVLGYVNQGAVAIFFSPPDDWNDLAVILDPEISATSVPVDVPNTTGFHYGVRHPVFDVLPTHGLMGMPYRNVLPAKTFVESSDEEIAGSLAVDRSGTVRSLGSDVLVRRYGSGRIVFTHMRIMERLGSDPVAQRLFVNLLRHFARRSTLSGGRTPMHQKSVEWLRKERTEHVRRWMVIGMFPNWSGEGHGKAYPPEEAQDFGATYPGWYRAIGWRRWYAAMGTPYALDLREAVGGGGAPESHYEAGTAYAYAEFTCDLRREAVIRLESSSRIKLWLNGREVELGDGDSGVLMPEVFFKQGRNSVLLKVSSGAEAGWVSFEVLPSEEELGLRWWS